MEVAVIVRASEASAHPGRRGGLEWGEVSEDGHADRIVLNILAVLFSGS